MAITMWAIAGPSGKKRPPTEYLQLRYNARTGLPGTFSRRVRPAKGELAGVAPGKRANVAVWRRCKSSGRFAQVA